MTEVDHEKLDRCIDEVERVRKQALRWRSKQIRNREHLQLLKALAFAWFKSWRAMFDAAENTDARDRIDQSFQLILNSTTKSAARTTYVSALKAAKEGLVQARSQILVSFPSGDSDEGTPDFTPLAADPQMKIILERRWEECQRCMGAGAHLAATVMMGGLLEALLLSRANRLVDKRALISAKAAPVDPKTKKKLELRKWTLAPYLDVAFELGWITRSGKDVGAVVRDYRNYIHPERERVHGVVLGADDSRMFWEVTKSLARQLLGTRHSAAIVRHGN